MIIYTAANSLPLHPPPTPRGGARGVHVGVKGMVIEILKGTP